MFEEFLNAISTVGFPIAVTCVVLYMYFKEHQSNMEQQKENMNVIANNTEALNRLSERLGVDTLE